MRWNFLNKSEIPLQGKRSSKFETGEIIKIVLKNRGLKTKKEIEEFLNSSAPEKFTAKDLGIDEKEVKKAAKRIDEAIKRDESIIVYGDYDADGICATAILWETLYKLTKNVLPYIPERVSEGYGLNRETIEKLKVKNEKLKVIITVDHGITAAEKIKYAKKLGIDIIVCDHHQIGKIKPKCTATIHTDKICAAAISWFLAKEILRDYSNYQSLITNYLDLVAIATIADLEPLTGINRSFAKYGLEELNKTNRCGLLAIFEEAGIKKGEIGTYEVGFIIAPRLNAMGRMDHALESLRLLCATKKEKAWEQAQKMGLTNKKRQLLMEETSKHARLLLLAETPEGQIPKLIFVFHESYQEGVIGLAAGKLTEEFCRPAIVVSVGEVYSKASARSINGFNIIEAIRAQLDLLVDVGGHPLAAGFTIETVKIKTLKQRLLAAADKEISGEMLVKTLKIDVELSLSIVTTELWEELQKMSPFGIGNPEPVFSSKAIVRDFRPVGIEGKHLKLTLCEVQRCKGSKVQSSFSAIAFNQGNLSGKLKLGQQLRVAYSLSLNEWNGQKNIELKIKDFEFVKIYYGKNRRSN